MGNHNFDNDRFDLIEYGRVILKRKKTISGTILICAAVSAILGVSFFLGSFWHKIFLGIIIGLVVGLLIIFVQEFFRINPRNSMGKYPLFDREELCLQALNRRRHDLDISMIKKLNSNFLSDKRFSSIGKHIYKARKKRNSAVILMLGGHVIRSGVQRYIIDLMEKGYITCLAMNGAGMIHDFEFALIGATTESVARYIQEGQFGLWKETGQINDFINQGYRDGLGMGEVLGKVILEGKFPYKDISLLAAGFRLKIPVTVHVGIGYDIIHEHPNCDGAATGATSYRDFLYFTEVIKNLEGGVVMNFGSAVMAPEVFLKALSMARNVAHQEKKTIKHFITLVCDLYDLPDDSVKEPDKSNIFYYFRPWKTMLVRTVAGGGESFYVKGKHEDTIPALWKAINENSYNWRISRENQNP